MKKMIPTDQHVTYQYQYRKCGKASCSTCRNSQGHGPYWYGYWRAGSKLISGYVGKTNPKPDQQNPTTTVSAPLPVTVVTSQESAINLNTAVACAQESATNLNMASISMTNVIVEEIIQTPVLV